MPKISRHGYDIAVAAVRRDHTSGVSVLKVYRPWKSLTFCFLKMSDSTFLWLRREQRLLANSAKIYGSTTNFSFFNYQTFAHRYVAYG